MILVRSGWQTINIGDIAHTPGLLAIIEREIPQAQVILWPPSVEGETEAMLRKRFPRMQIVKGGLNAQNAPDSPELREAFRSADLLMHGSAASVSAQPQFEAWKAATGKPYGFFGVGFTLEGEAAGRALNPAMRTLLDHSAFLFTRETDSLANLKKAGIQAAQMEFAPDGTFSMDITDEPRANAYLQMTGLVPGRFIAMVPRLRYTPYQRIRKVDWTPEETKRRMEVNDKFAEQDHAKLREAAIAYVRKTGGKVLLCPEMTYEIDEMDRLLFDPLPADIKPNVVRRKTFWLPSEATSVYKHAVAVISCECHSPILAAIQSTPPLYIHQPEDGIKGQMWNDIGLHDWYFQVDQTTGEQIASRVLEIAAKPDTARKKAATAAAKAQGIQRSRMEFVRKSVLKQA